MFTRILQWLILSSKDPNKIALTVRGALYSIVPIIITIAGLTNIEIQQDTLEAVIEMISSVIQIGLGIVASVMVLWGLVRKIWSTIAGWNKVIRAQERGDL